MLAFSFSGRLDPLDWVFYWGDVVARLLLPPLFVHFALVFPERPDAGRAATPAATAAAAVPAGAAAWRPHASRRRCAARDAATCSTVARRARSRRAALPRRQPDRRSGDHDPRARPRALGDRAASAALDRLGHGARRGAVRRRLRAAVRARASRRCRGFEFTAVLLGLVPLAFASAIVRYRLMDVEVIIKRGAGLRGGAGRRSPRSTRSALARRRRFSSTARRSAQPGHRAAGDDRRGAAVASGEERDSDRARSRLLPRPLRLPARAGRLCARSQQRSRSASG